MELNFEATSLEKLKNCKSFLIITQNVSLYMIFFFRLQAVSSFVVRARMINTLAIRYIMLTKLTFMSGSFSSQVGLVSTVLYTLRAFCPHFYHHDFEYDDTGYQFLK